MTNLIRFIFLFFLSLDKAPAPIANAAPNASIRLLDLMTPR